MIDFFRQSIKEQLKFSFDVELLKLSDTKPLSEELDEVYNKIKLIYASDEHLIEYINKAHEGGKFLTQIASFYDYDENTHENGYWTYIKLIIKFGKVVLACSSNGTFNREHIIDLFTILNTGLSICYEIQNQECKVKNCEIDFDNHEGFVKGVDLFKVNSLMATNLNLVELLPIVFDIKPKMCNLYAFYNFCWLNPSIIPTIQFFTTFLAVYSTQWKSVRFYNWLDRSNRGKMLANMGQNVNIDCLSNMWNLTEFKLYLKASRFFSNPDVQIKSVYVQRQKRWKLSILEPKVYDLHDEQEICSQNDQPKCKKDVVRALLLRSSRNYEPDNKSILLHLHGGGFISQSPESHESYTIDWAQQLKYPILSVDYSLSPEAPYPEALQEVLDCYLWLISMDESVKDAIGFYPEKIAICGDSAGGNLTMAVTLALNYMRNKMKASGEKVLQMPNGIFCFYSVFFMMTIISPSRLMCSVDGLIPIGVMLNCLGAYAPREVYCNKPQIDESVTQDDNSGSLTSLFPIRFIKTALFKIINTLTAKRTVPWYKEGNVSEQFLKLNKFLSNPFISPLLSKDLDFDDIPLYLYPLTYDFLLDESIEMAKSWKGKVHLEVIDELPHGFLNLSKFCDKAKIESRRMISRIPEVLE